MTLEDDGDHRVEGSLQHQIREAAEIMTRLMPKWRQLAQSGLFEPTHRIPQAAWLEGLANAVTHRSYSMMGDHIRVEIFPNRLEIYSPGRFPGITDPTKPLQISRYARNPRIARVLSDMGITRELGEGIQRMFEEMRRRGLADPSTPRARREFVSPSSQQMPFLPKSWPASRRAPNTFSTHFGCSAPRPARASWPNWRGSLA